MHTDILGENSGKRYREIVGLPSTLYKAVTDFTEFQFPLD